jgi:hypothetical protein
MLGVQQQTQARRPAQTRPQGRRAKVHLDLLIQGAAQPPAAGARVRIQVEKGAAHEGIERVRLFAQVRWVVAQVLQQALPEPGAAAPQHHCRTAAREQLGVGSTLGHAPGVEAQMGQLGQQFIPRAGHGSWLTLALLAGPVPAGSAPPAGISLPPLTAERRFGESSEAQWLSGNQAKRTRL